MGIWLIVNRMAWCRAICKSSRVGFPTCSYGFRCSWTHQIFCEGNLFRIDGVIGFFHMTIREKDITHSDVQLRIPIRRRTQMRRGAGFVKVWKMDNRAAFRKIAAGQIAIRRQNCGRNVWIGFQADIIAQIPVVELVEIRCRPALQICRTSEQSWRHQCAREWAEMLKRKVEWAAIELITGGNKFQRAAVDGRDFRGEFSAVVVRKQMEGQAGFSQVADTFNPFGPGFGLAESR